jgi:hypothetical protein
MSQQRDVRKLIAADYPGRGIVFDQEVKKLRDLNWKEIGRERDDLGKTISITMKAPSDFEKMLNEASHV